MASTTAHQTPASHASHPVDAAADTSDQHSHGCNDPTHNHYFDINDAYSFPVAEKEAPSTKRKAKKSKGQTGVLAKTIPGNRGDQSIDDLVNFINAPASTNSGKPKQK